MIFSSITFLFYFLPVLLIVYYLVPKKAKNIVLLVSSMLFYFVGEPKYIFLMLVSILVTYIFGLLISKYEKHSKILLTVALIITGSFLVFFKYTNFLIDTVNLVLPQVSHHLYHKSNYNTD